MSGEAQRRPVPSGRGLGFAKWQKPSEFVKGTLCDVFTLEDDGKSRDNIVLEVIEISVEVYNRGKRVPIQKGDLVNVSMGPKTLNGRAKFMTEGTDYIVEYTGLGTAKKAGHNPPKLFELDYYDGTDDEDDVDETDDGDVPF